ncbi:BamA/TamA family outer membrane protein [Ferruginibacter lapsinanis]|uniref:BamA/OMP85 family outer membrane protein n=1 Tax=Ferruginibacter lapsinanis TaxID=563172 RepID=UPI001E625669|nr:POTRA domain-containing protein [Ferruginibacter lapsinanis]UEG51001.1 BamA/TamA family outer membrane protein [Ferruginibacter lapsinanis]
MQRIYRNTFLIVILIFIGISVKAGNVSDTTQPVSADPKLLEIFNAKLPVEYTIANITVTGTEAFDPNLIISISGLAIGDKVQIPGTDAFSKAIGKLWRQNLIADVQIFITKLSGKDIDIEIAVRERPRLAEFKFIGVKKGEQDDLEGKVGLSRDRVVTENMKLSAVEIINKFYADKGYRNVTVEIKEETVPAVANAVSLTFYINKGKKVKVNSLNFSGNEMVSDAKLKKQMKGTKEMTRITLYPPKYVSPYGAKNSKLTAKQYLSEMGFLSISKTKEFIDPYFRFKLFSGAKFNTEKYQEDKEHLLDYYNAQGYRDAMIVADTQVYNNKGNLDVDIKVSEGHQYYFGNIEWRGNTKYSDSILNVLLGIKKGDVYNLELLNKRLGKQLSAEGGDISSLYMDDGYLFFRIDPVETSVYNDTIDFEIRMMEGPQATIGNISIAGNDKTKDYVIRRELRTIPGEKFSRADIIRTQRELGQLGFFNPEKTTPNVVPNADNGTVDIGWNVEEKSNDQLELSAGFGGGIGLTGTLGITFNNFSINNILKKSTWDPLPSGDGQKLSARIQSNGKAYRSYNFSFTEPWLGGKKRNAFTVSFFNTKYANAYDSYTGSYCRSCGDTSYIKTIGVGVSLGKQLKWPDDYFSLIYSFNLQQYKLKNYSNIFNGISNGTSTNVSLKIALARSATQGNPIFPTGGSNFVVSGQFTLPYSLMGITNPSDNQYKFPEFHKWRFNGEYYVPIGMGHGEDKSKQFILKASAKFGFIGKYNKDKEISPFERFQLGDAGLSNNFALLGYDIIAHRGYPVYSNSNTKVNPDNVTPSEFFTIFNKYTLELRYPFSTNPSSTIYGLAFFEAANGWYKFKEYNPFKLRRSAGVGMRFFLPMFGLLGFDYGIGLDRIKAGEPIKSAFKFTFMLGQEPE